MDLIIQNVIYCVELCFCEPLENTHYCYTSAGSVKKYIVHNIYHGQKIFLHIKIQALSIPILVLHHFIYRGFVTEIAYLSVIW